MSDIILESDYLHMVDALKKSSPFLSRQGPLVDEIKCLLSSFKSFKVLHVGRNENESLACSACGIDFSMVVFFFISDKTICNH